MDIKHLRYFVAMAEAGSLMKASERLHVAQPALSVHLSNLELELGVKLFERSHKGINLTDQGQLLYERATTLLRYHSEAILGLKRNKAKPAGTVSIGMPSTMPALFAPPLYKAMRDALPDVSLYILDASSPAVYEWLQNGKIDFAILFNIPEDIGLSLSPLFIEDYWLFGQFDDEDDDVDISFSNVFDFPLALPCRSTAWRKILEEHADNLGKSLSVTFESESYMGLRSLAMSGECYTILPRSSIIQDHLNGFVQARRIIEPEIRGILSLANLQSKDLTDAQKATRKVLTATIRQVANELGLGSKGSPSRKVCPGSLFGGDKRTPRPAHRPIIP